MAIRYSRRDAARLSSAIRRFNRLLQGIEDRGQVIPTPANYAELKTLALSGGRKEYNRILRSLNAATSENLQKTVELNGVRISAYEKREIQKGIRRINADRKRRLNKLGSSSVISEETEILKRDKRVPQFRSVSEFLRFRRGLSAYALSDDRLKNNYIKAISLNANIKYRDKIIDLVIKMSGEEFYSWYITHDATIGYAYTDAANESRSMRIYDMLLEYANG